MTDSISGLPTGLTINANYQSGANWWNSNSSAFEAFNSSHYNSGYYSTSAPENGAGTGRYTATTPSGVASGAYSVSFREFVGGTITTDIAVGSGSSTQTGDSYAYLVTNLGALGANATALAPASTALSTATWTSTIASRIDAAVSSRMATYTQPSGFLAATFPTTVSSFAGGAVASVTGSVGSVTGNVGGSVGSVTGAVGSVTGNVGGSVASVSSAVVTTYAIKKNTALSAFQFVMYNSSGVPTAGLTVTGQVCLDGASFVSLTNSVSAVSNGVYKVDLASADVNAHVLTLRFAASGATDTLIPIVTQS